MTESASQLAFDMTTEPKQAPPIEQAADIRPARSAPVQQAAPPAPTMSAPRSDGQERAEELRSDLREADAAYHGGDGRPTMSDAAYDAELTELKELEDSAGDVPPDSPTQTVGAAPFGPFGKIAHDPPMLSLRKADSSADLSDWMTRLGGHSIPLDVSLKYDGLSLALHYEKGRLVRAATRGDGSFGEEVTESAILIPNIPQSLRFTEPLEVRGEIVAINEHFETYNAGCEKLGIEPYSSPRNFASGTLRSLTPDPARLGILFFLPYAQMGMGLSRQSETSDALSALGFAPPRLSATVATLADIDRVFQRMETERPSMPYDTDGIVVRVDDHADFKALGATSNTPNGAVAYKFAASTARTVLTSVEWQVGRTGVITPRANLEPVRVGDVMVESATLHNMDHISKLGLMTGDTVVIERAGEVIPAVRTAVPELRDGAEREIVPPELCPACGGGLTAEGPARIYCTAEHCRAQATRRIEHFAARDYMRIEQLGPAVIELLHSAGFISDPADLYDLESRAEEIMELPGMGQASVEHLLYAIDSSKSRPLSRVMASLGIREVGRTASKAIAGAAGDMSAAMSMTRGELESLPDMGPVMTNYYLGYMSDPKSQDLIDRLRAAGVNMTEPRPKRPSAPAPSLAGKTVVVTGKLTRFTRAEINGLIAARGARAAGSVSRRTDYLVVGERPGSKRQKALDLGIPILTEDQFMAMSG